MMAIHGKIDGYALRSVLCGLSSTLLVKKTNTPDFYLQLRQMPTNFQNSYTDRFTSKFAISCY